MEQKVKIMKKNEQSFRGLWTTIEYININIGLKGFWGENRKDQKEHLENNGWKLSKFALKTCLHIQDASWTPSRMNLETHSNTTVECQRQREKYWKVQEKQLIIYLQKTLKS